ncbi:hypothetical protein IJ541_11500 [bacterium]|nr:hypothetical protein [bacterium]
MNNGYYENLDINFTSALKLYEENYTHNELIEFLKSGNIVQKQISALRLDGIYSQNDAEVLLSNLTGQDGKVREAVSLRLVEFMSNPEYLQFFEGEKYCQIFLDAIIDINGNICRNSICAISNLKNDAGFYKKFCPMLVDLTNNLLNLIEMFNFKEGKYKVNKEVFKLYWCLETIYEFYDKINFEDLKNILLRAKNIQEYTIREKAAKILSRNLNDKELNQAREELKNDSNYYVRRF